MRYAEWVEEWLLTLSPGRKTLFALAVAVAVLCVLEVMLRVLTTQVGRMSIPDLQVRSHIEQGSMEFHPELGWVRAQLPAPALGVNSDGFRYDELPREKPVGTWRAFTFGDSQTYGAGVEADESYTAFAERRLREDQTSTELQVVNAGISGYSSLQVLRLVRSHVLEWDPDLLIVDCRTFDSPPDEVLAPLKNRAVGLRRMLWASRTYYVLRFLLYRYGPGAVRPMTSDSVDAPPPPANDRMQSAGNHAAIVELAEDEGVDLVFLDYPFWDHNGITCLAPKAELPAGAIVVPVCQGLQRSGRPGSELFLDNNHLTTAGNELVGRALADGLRELGLVP